MPEPIVAHRYPFHLHLDPGTYWWCACGRSARQPFCDGSHEGTGLQPVELTLGERTEVWLCGCKRTARPPHCDGAHKHLPPE